MALEVSHYNFLQVGAPTVAGVAGNGISFLDACLINGWGSQTASSLTVTGAVATLTLPGTPAMIVQGLVEVSGVAGGPTGFALLNGKKKVLTVVGNVLTFDATGVSDGTATGTILAKVGSLGWTKVYSATNLAVYRSGDAGASQCLLRVDDTGTTVMRVVGYETMSDVNTGTGPFPTNTQQSGGYFWGKSNTADATTRQWHLVGDTRSFQIYMGTQNTASLSVNNLGSCSHAFGDGVPWNSADAFPCLLIGATTTPVASGGIPEDLDMPSTSLLATSVGHAMPRAYTQIGTAIAVGKVMKGINAAGTRSGGSTSNIAYPNGPNNGLIFSRWVATEPAGVRMDIPGIFGVPQNLSTGTPFQNRDMVNGPGSLAGRKLMALRSSNPGSATVAGMVFVDVTGPWR